MKNKTFDKGIITKIAKRVTKEETKMRTKHDKQVITLGGEYKQARAEFISRYSKLINQIVFGQDQALETILKKYGY